ncbi:MAG: hypothetical protein WKF97_16045 [Chitinophagaceae bacterium]
MIRLPRYTKKDILIMLGLLPLFVLSINCLLFGQRYLREARLFVPATLITFIVLALSWQLHTRVAVTVRNRFPRDRDMIRRMFIAIMLFAIVTGYENKKFVVDYTMD